MPKHVNGSFEGKKGMAVDVRGNNIEAAIRLLGRKMKQEGIIKEYRDRQYYEKPSVVKRRRHAEAVIRNIKMQQKMDEL